MALDADHVQICKFESPDEPNYELVKRNLTELVGDATKEFEDRSLLGYLQISTNSPASDPIGPFCRFYIKLWLWLNSHTY